MDQPLYQKNPKNLDGVPDLCQLHYLAEPNILHNLQCRYKKSKIYTSTTAKVLVAVNPYEKLPDIDSTSTLAKYQQAPVNLEGLLTSNSLDPHVFTVAHAAYHNMAAKKQNQSVVICGESGSGKTESAKLFMKFLAYTSTVTSEDPKEYLEAESIGKQVLDANPILESFGNAKTVLNNNSSRFGKFTKMQFADRNGTTKDCRLVGAEIETYLLEKSRVVRQDEGERNYHVFYYLCANAAAHPEWKLGNGDCENFNYLNQSGVTTLDGDSKTDQLDFKVLVDAMDTLKFTKAEQSQIFNAVAGILHLGNIEFYSSDKEGCTIADVTPMQNAALLFGVDLQTFEHRLLTRSICVGGTNIIKPLNVESAMENRDSIAKALFNGLFLWVVKRINTTSSFGTDASSWIGTLDVFGFEIFENNSFEQFCINFCNERLQQFFNFHVLKAEQDLYKREALLWTPIKLPENQDVIDLIMGKSGIFKILDSACLQPQGSDEDFTFNLFKDYGNHPRIEQQKFASPSKKRRGARLTHMNGFTVRHYAGTVTYNAKEFLPKNNDTSHPDTMSLFIASSSHITSQILTVASSSAKMGATMGRRGSMTFNSVSSVFSRQLQSLMDTLTATTPYFIRCIKPNMTKRPREFDADYVCPQLRYGGLIEALQIIKCGFPTRCSYERIHEQFGSILFSFRTPVNLNKRDFAEAIVSICNKSDNLDKSTYQLGLSMIFFKPGKQEFFRKILELSADDITTAQKLEIHHFLIHKRIVRMRGAVRGWLRLRHLFILRKCQKAATIMNIIHKTMFRALKRARRRLGVKNAAAEEERLAKDQKYQQALTAAAQLKVLQQKEQDWQLQMQKVREEKEHSEAARQKEVNSVQQQLANMHTKVKEFTSQIHELENANQKKQMEVDKTQHMLKQKIDSLATMEMLVTSQENDIRTLAKEKSDIEQQKLREKKQAEENLQSQMEQFSSKDAELQRAYDLLSQSNNQMKTEILTLRSHLADLKRQAEHSNQEFESKQADMSKMHKILQDQLFQKEKEMRVEQVQSQQSINSLERDVAQEKGEVQRLKEKLNRLASDNSSQKEELEEDKDRERRSAAEKQNQLEEKIRSKDLDFAQVSTQLALLQGQFESLSQQNKTQIKTNSDLQQKTQKESKTLKEELHLLQQKHDEAVATMKGKLESEKSQKMEVEKAQRDAAIQIQKLENELRRQKEQGMFDSESSKKHRDTIEKELESLLQEKQRLVVALDESKIQMQEFEIKFKQTLADHKIDVSNSEDKLRETQVQFEETLRQTKKGFREEEQHTAERFERQISDLKNQLAAMVSEGSRKISMSKEEYSRKLQQKDMEYSGLQMKIDEATEEMDDLQHRLNHTKSQFHETKVVLAEKEEEHSAVVDKLNYQLQSSTTKLRALQAELEDVREEMHSTNSTQQTTRDNYEQQLTKMAQDLSLSQETVFNFEKVSQKSRQLSSTQLDEFKQNLKDAENRFQTEIQAMQDNNNKQLQIQKAKFQTEREHLNAKLKEVQVEHAEKLKQKDVQLEQYTRKLSYAQTDLTRELNSTKEELRTARRLITDKERTMTEIQRVFEIELSTQKDATQRLTKKYDTLKQQNDEQLLASTADNRSKQSTLRKELRDTQSKADTYYMENVQLKKQIDVLSNQLRTAKKQSLHEVIALEDKYKQEYSLKESTLQRQMKSQENEIRRLTEETTILTGEHQKMMKATTERYRLMKEQTESHFMSEKNSALNQSGYVKDAFSQLKTQQQRWEDKQTEFEDTIQSMTEEISRLKRESQANKETIFNINAENEMNQASLAAQMKIAQMQAVNLKKNLDASHTESVSSLEAEIKVLKQRNAEFESVVKIDMFAAEISENENFSNLSNIQTPRSRNSSWSSMKSPEISERRQSGTPNTSLLNVR